MSGCEQYPQEPSICIDMYSYQDSDLNEISSIQTSFSVPAFPFQMTAEHLFQGSGIACLSARFCAPVRKRKFLILDQKIFLLIAVENILQGLPLLLYDKENVGCRKSGVLLCLGSSILCHHLHAQCCGLVSKGEEVIWELDGLLLRELPERVSYILSS